MTWQYRLIREKAETTYGTDPMIADADTLLVRNLTLRWLDGDYVSNDFATGVVGARSERLYNQHCSAEYEIEASTSGVAGTEPVYDHVLLGCGLSKTVVTGTSVSYSPTAAGAPHASSAMQFRNGLMRSTALGVRGSLSFAANVNRPAFFTFRKRGRFGAPVVQSSLSSPAFAGWTSPLDCTPANMGSFTIGGVALCLRSLSIQDGRTPVLDRFMTCGGVDIAQRAFTGRATVEWPAVATKDLIALARAGTTEALVWELGTVAGSRLRIAAPKVQMKYAGEENVDGSLGMNLDLVFQPDQGNDEIAFVFR